MSSGKFENVRQLTQEEVELRTSDNRSNREKIIRDATHIVDIAKGDVEGVGIHFDFTPKWSDAPDNIPSVEWVREERESEEFGTVVFMGSSNLGEYYAKEVSDAKPSMVFNTGFYAGVLAVNEGVITPKLFSRKITQIKDQETLF